MNRYDRQIRVSKIGQTGQDKITQATILIVGCGALGTYAAEQLVRAGIKHLFLIDPDTVELSNLQRQTLFTTADAEKKRPKVIAAAEQLQQINPAVEVTTQQAYFDHGIFEQFQMVDLVLDCTDNFLVRSFINDFCLHYKKPFIFASCGGTSGQVMALQPSKGPCLNCVFPNLTELEGQSCETLGVITPLISMISSIQISLAFQLIVEPKLIDWHTMHVIEAWPFHTYQFKISKNIDCPVCSKHKLPIETQTVSLKKACGNIFQANFSNIDLQLLEKYAQKENLTYKKNNLAIQIKLNQNNMTSFKNGRMLFYGYHDLTEVTPVFEKFKKIIGDKH